MINIDNLPKFLISKILLYLENPESKIIKNFEGYKSGFPMYSYLRYDRRYLPVEIWKYNYDMLHYKYYCSLFKKVTLIKLEVYNDYEKLWEFVEDIYPSSDSSVSDSI